MHETHYLKLAHSFKFNFKMKRPFQMVSHGIIASLLMMIDHIFNFQVNYTFIDGVILGMKSQSIAHYKVDANIYIGIWALKWRCTQHKFCE